MVVKWTQQVPKNRHIYTDLLQTEFKANMVFSHSLLVLVPQRSGLYQHDPYSSNKCCPFGQETDPLTSAMLAWLTLWHTIKLPSAFAPCFKQDRWAAPQKRGGFWCIMKRKPWDSNLPLQPSDHQPYPVTSKAQTAVFKPGLSCGESLAGLHLWVLREMWVFLFLELCGFVQVSGHSRKYDTHLCIKLHEALREERTRSSSDLLSSSPSAQGCRMK